MPDSFTPIHGGKDIRYCFGKSILIFDVILLYLPYGTYSCLISFLINKLFYAYLNIFPQAAPLSGGGRWKTSCFLILNFWCTQKIHQFWMDWWIFCDSGKDFLYFKGYILLFFIYQLNDSLKVYRKYSHCSLHLHVNKAWWWRRVITMPVL